MTQVFVSYKREDEQRVAVLVRALEREGLIVWWDRGLPGGESWRLGIQTALEKAGCVIVVWSHQSVGPSGDFVRDEAGHAKRRGILVPVRLDDVDVPLGFGEVQAIDLTRWKGRQRDPDFQDVVAAVKAKLEGRPAPLARGPKARQMRRLAFGGAVSMALWIIAAFGLNLFGLQERLCAAPLPLLQPHLSDLCGVVGLGKRPSREERLAWAGRGRGDCNALRAHIARFPGGAYRDEATSMIAARQITQADIWEPTTRSLRLFVGEGPPSGDTPRARDEALRRAQDSADQLCKGFAATASFRLRAATPVVSRWNCESSADGVRCGLEGEAQCQLDAKRVEETETCGSRQ